MLPLKLKMIGKQLPHNRPKMTGRLLPHNPKLTGKVRLVLFWFRRWCVGWFRRWLKN